MRPGSVCRHLKIAGRAIISRFFHVTSQQPRKLQHIPPDRARLIYFSSTFSICPTFFQLSRPCVRLSLQPPSDLACLLFDSAKLWRAQDSVEMDSKLPHPSCAWVGPLLRNSNLACRNLFGYLGLKLNA